jgi:hypothetical protein
MPTARTNTWLERERIHLLLGEAEAWRRRGESDARQAIRRLRTRSNAK